MVCRWQAAEFLACRRMKISVDVFRLPHSILSFLYNSPYRPSKAHIQRIPASTVTRAEYDILVWPMSIFMRKTDPDAARGHGLSIHSCRYMYGVHGYVVLVWIYGCKSMHEFVAAESFMSNLQDWLASGLWPHMTMNAPRTVNSALPVVGQVVLLWN